MFTLLMLLRTRLMVMYLRIHNTHASNRFRDSSFLHPENDTTFAI